MTVPVPAERSSKSLAYEKSVKPSKKHIIIILFSRFSGKKDLEYMQYSDLTY